jgi:hypothetical protein
VAIVDAGPDVKPDATLMAAFCRDELPALLRDGHGVEPALAAAVGEDVLARAEAFAALASDAQNILTAPFLEEVFDYRPREALPHIKGAVAVVVRNSRLDELHAEDGPVGADGVKDITTKAANPLSHLIVSRQRAAEQVSDDAVSGNAASDNSESDNAASDGAAADIFSRLSAAYPRAWACFTALDGILAEGGPNRYRLPGGPVPQAPAKAADLVRPAVTYGTPLFVPALSVLSRNQDELFEIIEYVLGRGGMILTANYLLRPQDVWMRRRELVRPDKENPAACLDDQRGLSGAHRAVAAQARAALDSVGAVGTAGTAAAQS